VSGVEHAIDRSVAFLRARQAASGWFVDYDELPVGASDGWVTAWVGRALAAAGARDAALACAQWLCRTRGHAAGFGYNASTAADADSTAHVLALARALDQPVEARDVAWLLARQRASGGFATYDRRDAWGVAHIDVTPVAFLALPDGERAAIAGRVRRFIDDCRAPDGTWPAYWWRSNHYSTYWNLRALRALGECAPSEPRQSALTKPVHPIGSSFELAFALGAAQLAGDATGRLLETLLAAQRSDGSWAGAPNLRLSSPLCPRPWESQSGPFYTDGRDLMTTASALYVLTTFCNAS